MNRALIFLSLFLYSATPLENITPSEIDAQGFKVIDSLVFDFPFTAYEPPPVRMEIKNDTFYILNIYGDEFFILNKEGSLIRNIRFNNYVPDKFRYSPFDFYVSQSHYVFTDPNTRPLLIDKSFNVNGLFWLHGAYANDYYYSPELLSNFFYNESNQSFYYPCRYGIDDTDTIGSLTHDYYMHNIVGAFDLAPLRKEAPSLSRVDTTIFRRIEEGDFLITHSDVYKSEKGFLPHLNFQAIAFDENKNEIIISEAADSLIRVYNIKGELLRTFGVKGKAFISADTLRFISKFNKNNFPKYAFSFIRDSLQYRSAYYSNLIYNHEHDLLSRIYAVPGSSKIISGKDAGYRSYLIGKESSIQRTFYVQVYEHEKLIGEFRMPTQWWFIGFRKKDLVFYRLFNVAGTSSYTLHVYFVSMD